MKYFQTIVIILLFYAVPTYGGWVPDSAVNNDDVTLKFKLKTADKKPVDGVEVFVTPVSNGDLLMDDESLSQTQSVKSDNEGYAIFKLPRGSYFAGAFHQGVMTYYSKKPSLYDASIVSVYAKTSTKTFYVYNDYWQVINTPKDAALVLQYKKDRESIEVVCSKKCPERIKVYHDGYSLSKRWFTWTNNATAGTLVLHPIGSKPIGTTYLTNYATGTKTLNTFRFGAFSSSELKRAATFDTDATFEMTEPTEVAERSSTSTDEADDKTESPQQTLMPSEPMPSGYMKQKNGFGVKVWWWNGNGDYAFALKSPNENYNGAIYAYRYKNVGYNQHDCEYQQDPNDIASFLNREIKRDIEEKSSSGAAFTDCLKVITPREDNYGLAWNWTDDDKYVDQDNGWSYLFLEENEDWEIIEAKNNTDGIVYEHNGSKELECQYMSDGNSIRMAMDDWIKNPSVCLKRKDAEPITTKPEVVKVTEPDVIENPVTEIVPEPVVSEPKDDLVIVTEPEPENTVIESEPVNVAFQFTPTYASTEYPAQPDSPLILGSKWTGGKDYTGCYPQLDGVYCPTGGDKNRCYTFKSTGEVACWAATYDSNKWIESYRSSRYERGDVVFTNGFKTFFEGRINTVFSRIKEPCSLLYGMVNYCSVDGDTTQLVAQDCLLFPNHQWYCPTKETVALLENASQREVTMDYSSIPMPTLDDDGCFPFGEKRFNNLYCENTISDNCTLYHNDKIACQKLPEAKWLANAGEGEYDDIDFGYSSYYIRERMESFKKAIRFQLYWTLDTGLEIYIVLEDKFYRIHKDAEIWKHINNPTERWDTVKIIVYYLGQNMLMPQLEGVATLPPRMENTPIDKYKNLPGYNGWKYFTAKGSSSISKRNGWNFQLAYPEEGLLYRTSNSSNCNPLGMRTQIIDWNALQGLPEEAQNDFHATDLSTTYWRHVLSNDTGMKDCAELVEFNDVMHPEGFKNNEPFTKIREVPFSKFKQADNGLYYYMEPRPELSRYKLGFAVYDEKHGDVYMAPSLNSTCVRTEMVKDWGDYDVSQRLPSKTRKGFLEWVATYDNEPERYDHRWPNNCYGRPYYDNPEKMNPDFFSEGRPKGTKSKSVVEEVVKDVATTPGLMSGLVDTPPKVGSKEWCDLPRNLNEPGCKNSHSTTIIPDKPVRIGPTIELEFNRFTLQSLALKGKFILYKGKRYGDHIYDGSDCAMFKNTGNREAWPEVYGCVQADYVFKMPPEMATEYFGVLEPEAVIVKDDSCIAYKNHTFCSNGMLNWNVYKCVWVKGCDDQLCDHSIPKPIADDPKPIVDDPKPIADEPKPIADEPKPIADEPEPVVDPKPIVTNPVDYNQGVSREGLVKGTSCLVWNSELYCLNGKGPEFVTLVDGSKVLKGGSFETVERIKPVEETNEPSYRQGQITDKLLDSNCLLWAGVRYCRNGEGPEFVVIFGDEKVYKGGTDAEVIESTCYLYYDEIYCLNGGGNNHLIDTQGHKYLKGGHEKNVMAITKKAPHSIIFINSAISVDKSTPTTEVKEPQQEVVEVKEPQQEVDSSDAVEPSYRQGQTSQVLSAGENCIRWENTDYCLNENGPNYVLLGNGDKVFEKPYIENNCHSYQSQKYCRNGVGPEYIMAKANGIKYLKGGTEKIGVTSPIASHGWIYVGASFAGTDSTTIVVEPIGGTELTFEEKKEIDYDWMM